MSEEIRFVPHSNKQEELIFSDADLTIGSTGTQWGKSNAGTLWMKRQTHLFKNPNDNFLIASDSYKIMNQSVLPYFLHYMRGFGEYKSTTAEFKLNTGGTVYIRTGTDPDSIVGIPNVRAYWLDEAGKARLYFWNNIKARAAAKGARGLLTTSPYTLNWLFKDYIKPKLRGKLPDVKLIQAASWENPYHSLYDEANRTKVRAQMDEREFDRLFGGIWVRMSGLVYDCWEELENIIPAITLHPHTRYVAGVDWGYSPDPFVLKVRAITPDGMHYGISEFYKTGQTPSDMVNICKQKKQVFGISQFYCDPSQPGLIAEMNRNGIPAVPADNDIIKGIGLHYELIKTRKFKIFQNTNPYTLDEIDSYHYPDPQDLKPDQHAKEQKPVDQNNHCLDADRYITISTYRSNIKFQPRIPTEQTSRKENNQQRISRLMRKKSNTHTESWE